MKPEDVANDPLLKDLNAEQIAAVMQPGNCIVLAGAGSGKTKVLTTRIAYMLREKIAEPDDILAVTFTNKAAKEMRERLTKMLGRSVSSMWLGTFHGLCHRMLRDNYERAGLPAGFSIMDEDDQKKLITSMHKENTNAPEGIEPKQLQEFINKAKEAGIRAGRMEAFTDFEDYAVPFYKAYETRCSRMGVIDFSELMLRVSELLDTDPVFHDTYAGRFKHIQVDEFQDTNAMQYAWLRALKGDNGHIFAVGDDDQSIYAFRGSDPQNMMDFAQEVGADKLVRLEQNYRSTGAILDAANALISNNENRLGKNLRTDAQFGHKLQVLTFEDDRDEADYVAKLIKKAISKGMNPKDIAILYRSNYQSLGYERALMANAVPFVIYGGQKFYERMEIKNVIAYLHLTTNIMNDAAFLRVVNIPSRGIGDATISQIAAIAEQHENRVNEAGDTIGMSLMEAATVEYDGNAKPKIEGFLDILDGLYRFAAENPLPDYLDYLIKATGLDQMYSKKEEDKSRLENLQEMVTAARRFCQESEIEGAMTKPAMEILPEFLATATLESAVDNGKNADHKAGGASPDAVTLMTVHASKGLEFPMIIVGGMEDGTFPSDKAKAEDGVDEERRLGYVAYTRAQERLYATVCKKRMKHGEILELEPSPFLTEVPEELKDLHFPASLRKSDYSNGQKSGAQNKWPSKKPWENKQGQNTGFKKPSPAQSAAPAKPVEPPAPPKPVQPETPPRPVVAVREVELVTAGGDGAAAQDAPVRKGFFKRPRPSF